MRNWTFDASMLTLAVIGVLGVALVYATIVLPLFERVTRIMALS